ncbi:MAG: lytic transglycosylase domain-containing protein [Clostridia bacterium]|nr:lytic transglycosylase domain-containing protein [Clostridia bacterium]MBR4799488.1 lytic transglycosylase domain-containing protein [Clostridia bacterium]MBR5746813.1 lytic transglycosylase domain-containing protein [Clostridia bacterium]
MNYKKFFVCAVLLIAFGVGAFFAVGAIKKSRYPREYSEYVEKYCAEYEVPQSLVYAVIRTESGFNKDAVSRAGAYGLMQVTPDTFSWLSRIMDVEERQELILDPETNIRYGVYYLRYLYERYGSESWETAAAGYNAGHNRVSGWLEDTAYSDDGKTLKYIPIEETSEYVIKVFKAKARYEEIYPDLAEDT